jgi:alkylhydroperoxidase/carboxymuconolactone decarboxylase family protein YurZ
MKNISHNLVRYAINFSFGEIFCPTNLDLDLKYREMLNVAAVTTH